MIMKKKKVISLTTELLALFLQELIEVRRYVIA